MMARPDKVDGAFYAQTLKAVQPTRMGISTGLWQSLVPDLWAYIAELPAQPQWKITPDAQLVSQIRQSCCSKSGVVTLKAPCMKICSSQCVVTSPMFPWRT